MSYSYRTTYYDEESTAASNVVLKDTEGIDVDDNDNSSGEGSSED